jgi:ABC-type transporter Mla subunit MlaD
MRRLALIAVVAIVAIIAVAIGTKAHASGDPYDVRAIFDDASFAVQGEQVRVAGAPVGSIV